MKKGIKAIVILLVISCIGLVYLQSSKDIFNLHKFTGNKEEYRYRYFNDRDKEWEEDIICIADSYLGENGHPYLVDKDFYYKEVKALVDNNDNFNDTIKLFEENKKAEFIVAIDQLLKKVPKLKDYEITLELSKIIASLHDYHALVYVPFNIGMPLSLKLADDNGNTVLFIDGSDAKNTNLLGSCLLEINGHAVFDVIDKIKQFISYDTEGGIFTTAVNDAMLLNTEVLAYVGVINSPEEDITIKVETINKTEETKQITPVNNYYSVVNQHYSYDYEGVDSMSFVNNKAQETNWVKSLKEENTVYIHLYSFTNANDINNLMKKVTNAISLMETCEKVVVDLRGNVGGNPTAINTLIANLNMNNDVDKYVFINEATVGAGASAAVLMQRFANDVQIVGNMVGENSALVITPMQLETENYHLRYTQSTMFIAKFTAENQNGLVMDYQLTQTRSDLEKGIDTYLKYVFK